MLKSYSFRTFLINLYKTFLKNLKKRFVSTVFLLLLLLAMIFLEIRIYYPFTNSSPNYRFDSIQNYDQFLLSYASGIVFSFIAILIYLVQQIDLHEEKTDFVMNYLFKKNYPSDYQDMIEAKKKEIKNLGFFVEKAEINIYIQEITDEYAKIHGKENRVITNIMKDRTQRPYLVYFDTDLPKDENIQHIGEVYTLRTKKIGIEKNKNNDYHHGFENIITSPKILKRSEKITHFEEEIDVDLSLDEKLNIEFHWGMYQNLEKAFVYATDVYINKLEINIENKTNVNLRFEIIKDKSIINELTGKDKNNSMNLRNLKQNSTIEIKIEKANQA